MTMPVVILYLFCVSGLVLCVGCESTRSVSATPSGGSPSVQSEFVQHYLELEKGMSAQKIEEQFGKPVRVEPLVSGDVVTEIWHYRETVGARVESNTQGMIEEPYWDIFENEMKVREVPVEGTERHEVIAELELLIHEGKLVSWKDQIDRRRVEY